jgi:hypothetical protein
MTMRPRTVRHALLVAALVAGSAVAAAVPASAQVTTPDTLVSVGSPPTPFSQNKQNEPALAVDANHPNVLVAGSNDNIDNEACNAGADNTCPFTPGVGVSGVYFSFDRGQHWTQPTYTGLTARNCLGAPGPDPECQPTTGPIGTLPWYAENGLASDGDPALAFGPVPGADGRFSWTNGSRLYYANLTSAVPGQQPFKGAEAIAVSRTDNTVAAANGDKNAWLPPVIASKQNGAFFSDKEQIWADNASSSRYFGNVYVCYAGFRSNTSTGTGSQPLFVLTSRDGGNTWDQRQVTSASVSGNSQQGVGRSGCTVRTDSTGRVYVFAAQFGVGSPGAGQTLMITSDNGGATFSRPVTVATAYDTCNYVEPSIGRCVEDGVAGARDDLSPAPSVDIANGAPTGRDATNQMVLSWVDGRDGLNHEHVMVTTSTDRGATWLPPRAVERPGDRGYYSAPAISPDGKNVWLVYNAFTTQFAQTTAEPRTLVGVVLHAGVTGSTVGQFDEIHRGQPGDARGSSQNNLAAEFLGDYVYAVATRAYGAAVWNDVRNAADCPAVDAYRQALHDQASATGTQTAEPEEPAGDGGSGKDKAAGSANAPVAPDVEQVCPATFGNTDIYGGSFFNP